MELFKKMKENSKYSLTIIAVTILAVVLLAVTLISSNMTRRELIELETTREVAHHEAILNQILRELETIAVFVETTGVDNITETNADAFATTRDFSHIGFVSFSIAPDGVMSYYYSEEYPDDIIGLDLINDERPYVRNAVAYAIANNVVVLNGPFTLIQGGEGIVFRKAIYEDGSFRAIINLVIQYNELTAIFDSYASDIVNVGIYQTDDAILFGDLAYRDDLAYLETISIPEVDWRIGVEVRDTYIRRNLTIDLSLVVIIVGIYVVGIYLGSSFYFKNQRLLKEQQILIHFDTLTDLPNRIKLYKDIEQLIEDNQPFYLGFGDLDNFKNLNDILGHSAGDRYLQDVAARFKSIGDDLFHIYRWGGDEFIFVIQTQDKEKAIHYLDHVYQVFKNPIKVRETDYHISISIGVVTYPQHGIYIDDLVKRADIVMYDIKSQNKNTYGFFENRYIDNLQRQLDFENKVNQYDISDYQVYLQPIISTETNEVVGFEALSRLFNKQGNPFNIQDVVKVLERKGEVPALDKHVFDILCDYYMDMLSRFDKPYFFSFNVSPLTLSDEFVTYMEDMIKSRHIDPSHFIIEMIETIGFSDINASIKQLSHLKSLGFKVAMDDFGMGYSSLSYIAKLPLSMIKIDRYFINNYYENEFDRLLIFAIRDISRSLQLDVVVEGIETQRQLDFIKSIGAKYYQGYYHSRPMSFDKILMRMKEGF